MQMRKPQHFRGLTLTSHWKTPKSYKRTLCGAVGVREMVMVNVREGLIRLKHVETCWNMLKHVETLKLGRSTMSTRSTTPVIHASWPMLRLNSLGGWSIKDLIAAHTARTLLHRILRWRQCRLTMDMTRYHSDFWPWSWQKVQVRIPRWDGASESSVSM